MEEFRNRLKLAMELKKVKSIELAEAISVSRSLISQYLSGKCKAKQNIIFLIAQYLEVSPSWLMGLDVPMTTNKDDRFDKIIKKMYKLNNEQLEVISNMLDVMFPTSKPKVELTSNEIMEEEN